ncbi:Prolipoprotein diacylglyceryl transferase [Botrimarina colliarenosi]|uniref:Prolipoprotein diacylglyceryl transferase n=1 Tax=Botrimarina colliarenosi TaxID=2528001 RepID=A0A5C6AKW8_9BACT|nr:prolipoprotein diacylglyceryl transferase family protein [Botrimarina colliarenosi]TWT99908.1 Prolipoprotein diacylglyceryl transferase [Botrimarina colliarenosi]
MIDPVYTLIMAAAVLAGGLMLRRSQRSLPIDKADRLAIGVAAFCGAMLGSKAPFVLAGDAAWWSAPAWLANGKTILAGLVGGYLAVELAKWALAIRTKTGDSFAPAVAVAVAIGRLGCFRAGCCYGAPTDAPWGVVFPHEDQLPRHPTQLYEAGFHAVMAIVLITLQRSGRFRGQLLKLYIMSYALYRLATETIRPEPTYFAGLTAYQAACLLLLPLFAFLWWRDARNIPSPDAGPAS